MQPETRTKLKAWLDGLEKLDEHTKEQESRAWIMSVLEILGEDEDFKEYLAKLRITT